MAGGTTFFFVTDGIESAFQQAKQAAGGRDVLLGGGANLVQQYLAAGLVDEFELHLVPILLGDGERLLEHVGDLQVEQVRAVEAPGVTHISTASPRTAEAAPYELQRASLVSVTGVRPPGAAASVASGNVCPVRRLRHQMGGGG